MAPLAFTKMEGCGNDYVYLDCWSSPPPRHLPALARAVSDRHRGIGADGLILLLPSHRADCRMVMLNADGSRSEMCGNGIRCLAKLAYDLGRIRTLTPRIETGAGVLTVALAQRRGHIVGASVDMGIPRLTPDAVPVRLRAPGPLLTLPARLPGVRLELIAVGMGNPHAVAFVPDPERVPVESWGPRLEHDRRFPRRTNVEFAAVLRRGRLPRLRQRTWERGAGITLACGTGACAVAAAAMLSGRIPWGSAQVQLDGGVLTIHWQGPGTALRMEGPARTVFTGTWDQARPAVARR